LKDKVIDKPGLITGLGAQKQPFDLKEEPELVQAAPRGIGEHTQGSENGKEHARKNVQRTTNKKPKSPDAGD